MADSENPSPAPMAPPASPAASETLQKLEQLKYTENRTLYRAKTVFPFRIFPTEIIITENSVEIVSYTFFYTKQVFPMLIKDIKNVQASTDMFFSSLTFELSGYETNPPDVSFLPRNAGILIKRIIKGLLVCQQKGIDLTPLEPSQIVDKIIEIGAANTNSTAA